jgi:hypothetical protein
MHWTQFEFSRIHCMLHTLQEVGAEKKVPN